MHASDQGFSMPIKAAQGTHADRGLQGNTKYPPSFPMGVTLPNELQGEIPIVFIREGFQDEVFFIPMESVFPRGNKKILS